MRRQRPNPARWLRRNPIIALFVAFTLITAGVVWRTQQIADQQTATSERQIRDNAARISDEDRIVRALHADLTCVERWANRTTNRSQKLQPLATARIENLFQAFRLALHGKQAAAKRLAKKALREDRRYLRALRRHPIPEPLLHCRRVLEQPSRAGRQPPAPRPVPARPTATVTVPGPTRTVTVRVPGPTVTRTVVRTVTVTVPPGHQHRHAGRH